MRGLVVIDRASGAYRFDDGTPEGRLERWTAFASFHRDGWMEEIDLDAPDQAQAYAVARAALAQDYEPGGTLVRVVHRPRGVAYF